MVNCKSSTSSKKRKEKITIFTLKARRVRYRKYTTNTKIRNAKQHYLNQPKLLGSLSKNSYFFSFFGAVLNFCLLLLVVVFFYIFVLVFPFSQVFQDKSKGINIFILYYETP